MLCVYVQASDIAQGDVDGAEGEHDARDEAAQGRRAGCERGAAAATAAAASRGPPEPGERAWASTADEHGHARDDIRWRAATAATRRVGGVSGTKLCDSDVKSAVRDRVTRDAAAAAAVEHNNGRAAGTRRGGCADAVADADDCGEHAVAGDGEQHGRPDAAELLPCAAGGAAAADGPAGGGAVQHRGGDGRWGGGGGEPDGGDAAAVVAWGVAGGARAVYVV